MPAGAFAPLETLGLAPGVLDAGAFEDWAALAADFDGELTDSGSFVAHPAMAIEAVVTRTTAPAIVFLRKAKAM
ncbi:hypothetical protein B6N42_03680 [Cutibacterium avidum]|nr:hypothetical protein B6N40_10370 [Cutibacterium avidum]PGX65943.1 hypothetical protein B6N41_02685 [Cutibacterium avidum]PGX66349.1 hypothetical protein B6N42_03680 [Cutibacterium avidum]